MNAVDPVPPPPLPPGEALSLQRWIAQIQRGEPLVVLVTGGLGSGKSTLQRRAMYQAASQGMRTGRLLLGGTPRVAPVAPADVARAPRPAVTIEHVLRSGRLDGERWLIGLDDAHLQDPDDVTAAARAVAGSGAGLGLLISEPDDLPRLEAARVSELQVKLAADANVVQYQVQPWSGVDVNELVVGSLFDPTPSIRFGFELARLTAGNAAMIHAYAEAIARLPDAERLEVVSGSRRLVDLPIPDRVLRLVGARLGGVSGDARRLLQTLALWGLPGDPEVLARLSGLDPSHVEMLLDELEDGGHVQARMTGPRTTFLPLDQVTGLVLAQQAPSLLARRVHAEASEMLAAQESAPHHLIARAQHHLNSRPLDARRAQQVLDAATLLLGRGRHVTARVMVEIVVADAITEDLPGKILERAVQLLAEAYSRAGDTDTAERLVAATRVHAEGADPSYLRARLGLARTWLSAGRELEAEATLRYLIAHPQTPRDVRFGATAELVRLHHWSGQPQRATEIAEEGREHHRGEPDAQAQLWFHQALVSHMDGRPDDAQREASRAFWLAREVRDRGTAAKALVTIGEATLDTRSVDRALTWLRGGITRAERSQSVADVSWIRNRLIPAYVEAGDWSTALLSARRGIAQGASINLPHTLRRSRAAVALVEALRGQVDERWLREQLTATDFSNPLLLTAVGTAIFEQERAAGRHDHAYHTIALMAEALDDRPGWVRFLAVDVLPRLAACLEEREDVEGLRRVVERLREVSAARPALALARTELLVAEGRLALAEGRAGAAIPPLERARHTYESMAYRWRGADLTSALARAYAGAGQRGRAIDLLRSGIGVLTAMGASTSSARQRALLQTYGGRLPRAARGEQTLTRRQMEIAILAARGLTDKEIAREVGVTWRTVTTHMHAILRRLELRSRRDLPDWLAQSMRTTR